MRHWLLWLINVGVILYSLIGFTAILGAAVSRDGWRRCALAALTILGPVLMGLYWWMQNLFHVEETLFWSRLMAGDSAGLLRIASVSLIVGSALAMGALSLGNRIIELLFGAVCVSLMWIVIYLHPTPHYVPFPPEVDKAIWFCLLVGGAAASVAVYLFFRPRLERLKIPATIVAGVMAMPALVLILAHGQAAQPLELADVPKMQRIQSLGCLACHTIGKEGQSQPGGGLESVASRNEDVVLAFLEEPTAEKARQLKIKTNPTGKMAGVHFSTEEARLVLESLKMMFKVKPPTQFGPGNEAIEAIVTQYNCLACHSYKGEGAPDGGLGGAFENAGEFSYETLVEWLKAPSVDNAVRLKIREVPMGAMEAFPLSPEQAEIMARWFKTLDHK